MCSAACAGLAIGPAGSPFAMGTAQQQHAPADVVHLSPMDVLPPGQAGADSISLHTEITHSSSTSNPGGHLQRFSNMCCCGWQASAVCACMSCFVPCDTVMGGKDRPHGHVCHALCHAMPCCHRCFFSLLGLPCKPLSKDRPCAPCSLRLAMFPSSHASHLTGRRRRCFHGLARGQPGRRLLEPAPLQPLAQRGAVAACPGHSRWRGSSADSRRCAGQLLKLVGPEPSLTGHTCGSSTGKRREWFLFSNKDVHSKHC